MVRARIVAKPGRAMPLLVAALAAFVLAAVPLAAQERPVSGPVAPRQSAPVSGPYRPAAPTSGLGNGPASVSPGDRPGEADRAAHPADAATLPHDLSPWGMFLAADRVVKSVMVGLAFASMATWTIWLAKALELAAARARARRAVVCLERAASLGDALAGADRPRWPKRGPVAALAQAASLEVARSDGLGTDGVKDRAAVALQRIEARAGRTMSRGTGLLATIGSTAPFVGLFGTVWGIMNAFIGISRANTTNLAVVAPGIAEALLATAIGLVAAIPAVVIYNVFARSIAGYRAILADASAEILRHLSRDLDRRAVDAGPAFPVLQAAE